MVKYQGLQTLEVLEGADNYNKWIASEFIPHLKSPILEIGSGIGNISNFFLDKKDTYLSDADEELVKYLKGKYPKIKNQIFKFNLESPVKKNLTNHFQTVIGINVLEHVKNDVLALHNLYKVLNEDGELLLLVPSKKIAYTFLDKQLGHYRRYEKKDLEDKLNNSGFEIVNAYSFNFVGFFSWIARDLLERGHHLKTYQVRLFDRVVPILKPIERILKPPVGVSLIVRARKLPNK